MVYLRLRGPCAQAAIIGLMLLAAQLAMPAAAESKTSNRRLPQFGGQRDNDEVERWQQQFQQPAGRPGQGQGQRQGQGWGQGGAGGATRPRFGGSGAPGAVATGTAATQRPQFGGTPSTSTAGATAATTSQGQGRGQARGNPRGLPRGFNSWRDALTAQAAPAVSRTRGVRRQRVAPTTAQATAVAQSLGSGNAQAAAQSIATAADANPQFAAEGIVSAVATAEASSSGGGVSTATAEAIVSSVSARPNRAGAVFAQSASLAVGRGYGSAYSKTMAQAFTQSRRRRNLPQFTQAVTQALTTGDDNTKAAFGEAIATAVASGGDGQAAVAEATATAFCSGGGSANAWASAYAVALTQNARGCLVLNQAKAIAQARCGGGQFTASAQAEATSTVLGFCGLLPGGFLDQFGSGWSTSQGGATASQGAFGQGFGSAFGGK